MSEWRSWRATNTYVDPVVRTRREHHVNARRQARDDIAYARLQRVANEATALGAPRVGHARMQACAIMSATRFSNPCSLWLENGQLWIGAHAQFARRRSRATDQQNRGCCDAATQVTGWAQHARHAMEASCLWNEKRPRELAGASVTVPKEGLEPS